MQVTEESKAEALRRVAGSVAFHRADVLKALLEYLHTQDSLGRAHEVTESEIAMKVMGRGPTFSPESDSSVRTRFLALRKKLDEYYAGEGQDAVLRMDVPRGTYTLRFVPNIVEPPTHPPPEAAPNPTATEPRIPTWRAFLLGVAACISMLALVGGIWAFWRGQREGPEEKLLALAWGSMLEKGSSVTIAIGTPASFFVRDFGNAETPTGDPGYRPKVERDLAFDEWYKSARNAGLGKNFILHPNNHSPLWGDSAAASLLSGVFGKHGVSVELAPSARVHPVALRERNAVIIGRPEYTDAAKALPPDDSLIIEYSEKQRAVGIHNRAQAKNEPDWWFATGGLRHNYGLITVLTADTPAKKRTVLLAGINSDGAEAGARFLTSADKLQELDKRFRQAGFMVWPPRYQVVVRTESVDTYSLQTKFEFLRVLK